MSNIKVLILDIDGTIAGKSNQVNEEVKNAIKKVQKKGIKVGLATGRMYCSALRFHHEIEADLPIIAYNGAWIQNPSTSEMLLHQPVNKNTASELLTYFRQQQQTNNFNLEVHLYFEDQLYVEKCTPKTDFYIERSGTGVNIVNDFVSLLNNHPTKLLALSENADFISHLLQDLKQHYSEDDLYLTQSSPIYLEATQARVNKGNAVKYLVEKILGLSADELMAIGDNFNDYAMLEYAGLGIAMGSAPKEVKELAHRVTTCVEEDGVVKAIEHYLF